MSKKALATLTSKLAARFDMEGAGEDLIATLKATAFKDQVTDAQMAALLLVANQHGLNPWVKEIYAFPDKQNGIVPVVGVDGWSRIMNEHPQFDGIEFEQATAMADMPGAKPAPEWMECRIYRKDRTRPIVVREYLDEVYRPPFTGKYGTVNGPWQSHTKRFLRHKTMIQCARLAFGFGGIYDQDEAERIIEGAEVVGREPAKAEEQPQLAAYPDEKFASMIDTWRGLIEAGKKDAAGVIAAVSTKYTLSESQAEAIRNLAPIDAAPEEKPDGEWLAAYESTAEEK